MKYVDIKVREGDEIKTYRIKDLERSSGDTITFPPLMPSNKNRVKEDAEK
jgi:hypothetical protein